MKRLIAFIYSLLVLQAHLEACSCRPVIPPVPPSKSGLLPFVINNKSNLPDDQVAIVITGKDESQSPSFVQFDADGVGLLINATSGDNASNYSKTLDQFPVVNSSHVIYLPAILEGSIWFSMQTALTMPVDAQSGEIVIPNGANPLDPNYDTIFDVFHVSNPTNGMITANPTAISMYSLSLYGYLSTPMPNTPPHAGTWMNRVMAMNRFNQDFQSTARSDQWLGLILKNQSKVLRVISPIAAIANGLSFDPHYFSNPTSGYDFIAELLNFYRANPGQLAIQVPSDGSIYSGAIQPDNTLVFTNVATPSDTIVLNDPSGFDIFSKPNIVLSASSLTKGAELSNLFQQAILIGFLPGLYPESNPISESYCQQNRLYCYKGNSLWAENTGPWCDLYSGRVSLLGRIYTGTTDDAIYRGIAGLKLTSNGLQPDTYFGITIGVVE